eukprot:gene23478-29696_t
MLFVTEHNKHSGGGISAPKASSNNESNRTFAMLHAFKGHTKAVTAIQLHPVSGLAISASLDGFVKILNLEAMTELYCVNVDSAILELKVISLSATDSHYGIMFTMADATIKLWKITSCCTFFSVCTSKIAKLTVYENLQLENEKHFAVQQLILRQEKFQIEASRHGSSSHLYNTPLLNVDDPAILIDADDEDEVDAEDEHAEGEDDLDGDDEEDRIMKKRNKAVGLAAAAAAAGAEERILVGFSSQDLRAFTQKGVLLGRFEPEHVVDGIKAYAVSVFQKLLFLLTDSDKIRVHDLKRYTCPLVKEHDIKGSTVNEGGLGTSCALIDCIPNNALRSGGSKHHSKHDSRGTKIASPSAEEFLLVGMKNGAILFMDTLTNCEVAVNIQAHNGIICELKYRQAQKELFVLGSDFGEVFSSVRVFQLPQMELLYEVGSLKHISCFEISSTSRMFAIGNASGLIRLFTSVASTTAKTIGDSQIKEVVRHGQNHENRVSSICFNDTIRVYMSCSLDSTVKIWDYEKRLVRTVVLNNPSSSVACNGIPGDVVITQGTYLLTIPRVYWDEGDALQLLRNAKDPWDVHDDTLAGVPTSSTAENVSAEKQHSSDRRRSSADHRSRNGSVDTEGSMTGSLDSLGEDSLHSVDSRKRRASTHNHNLSFVQSGGRKASVSFARNTRSTGLASSNLVNKFGLPVTVKSGHSFVTQQKKRISIDDIENELLPKLQLQFIRSINNANNLTNSTQYTATSIEDMNSLDSSHRGGNFTLTNNDWTTLSQKVVVTANAPNDSKSIDVLHPRFLLHKKPTAKTFRFEDLNLSQPQHAKQGHNHHDDNEKTGVSRSEALSFADPNQYLTRSGSNLSHSSTNERVSSADTKFRHRFSVSATPNSKLLESDLSVEPVVTSPVSRRSAQIGLSPRAQLTLLNSNEKITSAAAREQQDQIIFATLGMRVSAHYKRHRESLHVRHEADFQEKLRSAAPTEPARDRNSSFHLHHRHHQHLTVRHQQSQRDTHHVPVHDLEPAEIPSEHSFTATVALEKITIPVLSSESDLNDAHRESPTASPTARKTANLSIGQPSPPPEHSPSSARHTLGPGFRRRNNAQTVGTLAEDDLARLVEQKVDNEERDKRSQQQTSQSLLNETNINYNDKARHSLTNLLMLTVNGTNALAKDHPSLISPNRKKNTIREDITSRLPVALLTTDENNGNINKHALRRGVLQVK